MISFKKELEISERQRQQLSDQLEVDFPYKQFFILYFKFSQSLKYRMKKIKLYQKL